MSLAYIPRNDLVVIRVEVVNKIGLVAVPERSKEGQKFYVHAVGPKVEGLKVGDRVIFGGSPQGGEVSWIPGAKGLMLTRQENILVVIEEGAGEEEMES